jgi:hypothetical protein
MIWQFWMRSLRCRITGRPMFDEVPDPARSTP